MYRDMYTKETLARRAAHDELMVGFIFKILLTVNKMACRTSRGTSVSLQGMFTFLLRV